MYMNEVLSHAACSLMYNTYDLYEIIRLAEPSRIVYILMVRTTSDAQSPSVVPCPRAVAEPRGFSSPSSSLSSDSVPQSARAPRGGCGWRPASKTVRNEDRAWGVAGFRSSLCGPDLCDLS